MIDETPRPCLSCEGRGEIDEDTVCLACDGTGQVAADTLDWDWLVKYAEGQGWTYGGRPGRLEFVGADHEDCPTCGQPDVGQETACADAFHQVP